MHLEYLQPIPSPPSAGERGQENPPHMGSSNGKPFLELGLFKEKSALEASVSTCVHKKSDEVLRERKATFFSHSHHKGVVPLQSPLDGVLPSREACSFQASQNGINRWRVQGGIMAQSSEPPLASSSLSPSLLVKSVSAPLSLRIWCSDLRRFFSTLPFLSLCCCFARARAASFSVVLFDKGAGSFCSTGEEGWKKKGGGRRVQNQQGIRRGSGTRQTHKLHEIRLRTHRRVAWNWGNVWDDGPIQAFENFHGLRELVSDLRVAGGRDAQPSALWWSLDSHLEQL